MTLLKLTVLTNLRYLAFDHVDNNIIDMVYFVYFTSENGGPVSLFGCSLLSSSAHAPAPSGLSWLYHQRFQPPDHPTIRPPGKVQNSPNTT